jgi:PAS domain S-box-containing protein
VLQDAEGKPYGFVAIIRDITGRKQAEEALRQSRRDLATLTEISSDAMISIGPDGLIALFNPAAEKMFGWTKAEMLGQPLDRLMPEAQRGPHREHVRNYFETGSPHGAVGQTVEVPAVRKNGEEFPVELSLSATERQGRPLVLAILRDITARKRVEEALRESVGQLQAIYDGITDGLLVAELDTGRIVRVSPAACAMFGYSESEFLEKRVPDLHPADSLTEVMAEFHAQASGEKVVALGLPCRRKDGSIFSADIAARPIVYKGQRSLVGFFRDITERKRAERELEAKNRELESFVYTVSHDLRAPLVSLEGFARLLAEEQGDRLDAEGQDYLRRLRANVGVMNSLLLDLLELSRVGRRQEPAQAVAVSEVVAEARESLAELVGRAGAKLEVAADLPLVWYSRLALSQVFVNLISNAIKFSREGEIPRVEIGWEKRPGGGRFHVTDNGIGIAQEHRQRVFEIFSRLKQKPVEGTGIGLAIVKRIVESNGGEVGVDSRPGEGSTFWFTVPDRAEGS